MFLVRVLRVGRDRIGSAIAHWWSPRGFTLAELLIAVTVIGVLAAIAIAAMRVVRDTGEGSACRANLRQVTAAQEAYFALNNAYADVDTLVSAGMLRKAPPIDHYVISANAVTGKVAVDPPRCKVG